MCANLARLKQCFNGLVASGLKTSEQALYGE